METSVQAWKYAKGLYLIPLFMVFNAGKARRVKLPAAPSGEHWVHEIDTADPARAPGDVTGADACVAAQSVSVFVLDPDG